jgi:Na+-translocating ferredoxin:NAD+ oxidoreductase RnfD subunit
VSRALSLKRFLRTPKGLLLAILTLIIAIAAGHEGWGTIAPGVVNSIVLAGVLDALILRWRRGRWEFPDGAILSAMLVAMVMSAQQRWRYTAITAVVAIISKYVFRSRAANVFNPAAFALVATFYVFDTGQSWWGALPAASPFAEAVIVLTGVFIADRVNKMPLVLTFLGVYYGLFTITSFLGDAGRVAEVFRTPDLQAAIFFAVFILTDPPTSPVKYQDQIIYGVIVAGVSFAVFQWIGAAYYLLAGVLVGNVWEAWRRVSRRTGVAFPRGTSEFLRELTPWRRPTLAPQRVSQRTVRVAVPLIIAIPAAQPRSRTR